MFRMTTLESTIWVGHEGRGQVGEVGEPGQATVGVDDFDL